MSHSHPQGLAHQFDDLEQQHEASSLGMWGFLITEVMFFGGLFAAYMIFRWQYPEAFTEASHNLDAVLGGINTCVLLVSSLTMALAVHAAQEGKRKQIVSYLIVTMILGAAFLGVKAVEYSSKWEHGLFPGFNFTLEGPTAPQQELYFYIYFIMTGIHALHMIIGIVIVGFIARSAAQGRYTPSYYNPVEMIGLYWHFVDIIWIFLYPLLYLIDPLSAPSGGGH